MKSKLLIITSALAALAFSLHAQQLTLRTNVVQVPVTNVTVYPHAITNVVAVDASGNALGTIWTDTNALSLIPAPVQTAVGFLTQGTNWMIAPFAIYDTGTKSMGGGIAALYSITPYVATGLRMDYLSGSIFMPSMNVQLEVPIKVAGKFTAIPFTFGGMATVLSGKGQNDNQPVGLFGIGMAVRLSSKFDLVTDIEKWTSPFTGKQYRFGFLYKF